MAEMVTLFCLRCNKIFERLACEHRRCLRQQQATFCSTSCATIHGNITKFRDKFTPFRSYLKRSKDRIKKSSQFRVTINEKCTLEQLQERQRRKRERLSTTLNNNLTLEFLMDLWKSQGGICPFTGWQMHLTTSTVGKYEQGMDRKKAASLDRIDNSKGYIKGNVRFVSMMANLARGRFTDDDLVEFGRAVSGRHP